MTRYSADIYGFLRFGHFRPWKCVCSLSKIPKILANTKSSDWDDFNAYIAKMQLEDAPLAGTYALFLPHGHMLTSAVGMRAQEILKPLLLRRTKDSQLVSSFSFIVGAY